MWNAPKESRTSSFSTDGILRLLLVGTILCSFWIGPPHVATAFSSFNQQHIAFQHADPSSSRRRSNRIFAESPHSRLQRLSQKWPVEGKDRNTSMDDDIEDYIRQQLFSIATSSSTLLDARDKDTIIQQVAHVFMCPATQDMMNDNNAWQFDRWNLELLQVKEADETSSHPCCRIMAEMTHGETGIEATLTFHRERRTWMYCLVDPDDGREFWMDLEVFLSRETALIESTTAGTKRRNYIRATTQKAVHVLLLSLWCSVLILQPGIHNLSFLSAPSLQLFLQNMRLGASFCLNTVGGWARHHTVSFLLIAYVLPWMVQRVSRHPSPHLVTGLEMVSNASRAFHLLGLALIRMITMVLFHLPATLLEKAARLTSQSLCSMVEAATFTPPRYSLVHPSSRIEALPVSSIQAIGGPTAKNAETGQSADGGNGGVSLSAVVQAPFLEEFIYRYSIASMFRAAAKAFAFRSGPRLLTRSSRLLPLKTPIWGVISSIVFGMAHMCNHFPASAAARSENEDGVYAENGNEDEEAIADAVGSALVHCSFSILSSLLVYIPAYRLGGLGGSIGAHVAWNAMVVVEEKGRDMFGNVWQRIRWRRRRTRQRRRREL